MQMVSVHAMEVASLETRKLLMQEPDIAKAASIFGDVGIIAAQDFLIHDTKFKERKDEGLTLLGQLFDVASNYDVLVDMTNCVMTEHVNYLPYIYGDKTYDEFEGDIKNNYNKLFKFAKQKKHDDVKAQALFADALYTMENTRVMREGIKRVLLETRVVEILRGYQNKINECVWRATQKTNLEAVEILSQEYKRCIKNCHFEDAKIDAQKNYIKMCYDFSYCAWLQNSHDIALKYGKEASDKALEWGQNEPISQKILINWHSTLSGKKHKEFSARPAKTSFRKRKLPRPKPFEKKQKMFTE